MARNLEHNMLASQTAEDQARQRFILALKGHLGRQIRPRLKAVYERQAAPAYQSEHGASPQSQQQIGEALYANSLHQAWSSLQRGAQENMWRAVKAPIDRDRQRLEETYGQKARKAKGSLELDPDLDLPEEMQKVHVHLQPGGYLCDEGDTDILAGALYEAGGRLYSQGAGVGTKESKAECVMRFLAGWAPEVKPRRILDLACSAGSSSVPYALALPDAEVHAIDIAPSMLRYAHARAEALGARVHFHQQRVEDLKFDDASFDLIISHNAMHELSLEAQQKMMSESYRLLKTGGVCVHQDVPLRFERLDPFMQVLYSWDEWFNGEPFWSAYANNDCRAMLQKAGFEDDQIFVDTYDQIDGSFEWYIAAARKTDKT